MNNTPSSSPWSVEAWQAGEPAFREILRLPFVTELADGSLSRSRFLRYIAQDRLYLAQYSRVLAHIAARTAIPEVRDAFLAFAAHGVAVEQSLHESFIDADPALRNAEMSPACLFYTSLLKAAAFEPVEVEAAAILPCFWIYQKVGEWISDHHSREDNPYSAWIATYADPAFAESTDRAIALCNRLADDASPAVRARMTDYYRQCSRMEWLFWHSAYTGLNYPAPI